MVGENSRPVSPGARELEDEMETLSPILSGDRKWIQEETQRWE